MAQDEQEKSHKPTAKKLQEAHKQGQIPRSKELNTTLIMLSAIAMFLITGQNLWADLQDMMKSHFQLSQDIIKNPDFMFISLINSLKKIGFSLLPFFFIILIAALLSPLLLGGWILNFGLISPKFNKINPLNGIKRMFSLNTIAELIKSFLKISLIVIIAFYFIIYKMNDFFALEKKSISLAIVDTFTLISQHIYLLLSALVLITCIDVPYQLWSYAKKLKMSTQEIREESKESEVRPEIKQKVRHIQQKMLQNRMIREIPKADIIITNPTHYAVALKYDEKKHGAPKLVAKGQDLMAQQILLIAKKHQVEVISIPPLARSIFYNTTLFHEIPQGLYLAVAQVLAYIYQLKRFRAGYGEKPLLPTQIPIPVELEVNN